MRYSPLVLVLGLISCGDPPRLDEEAVVPPRTPLVRVAGYDVSALELAEEDFTLARQKMGKSHVLWMATLRCNTALLNRTLADGASPDVTMNGSSSFTEAMYCGDEAIPIYSRLVTATLEQPGNFGMAGSTLHQEYLTTAIQTGNVDLTNYLLDQGADQDSGRATSDGCPATHYAMDTLMLANLLQQGGRTSGLCDDGTSILHNAVYRGDYDIIDYLLRHDLADRNVTDAEGHTPYDLALIEADYDIIELLRE